MKKLVIKECISLKNNPKTNDNLINALDMNFLKSNKLSNNSLRALLLKYKTQKSSPERNLRFNNKNNSINKDKFSNKNIKSGNSNKAIIKVLIPKNNLNNEKDKNKLSHLSNENRHILYFRNKLIHNNRYNPKSFENKISSNINKKEEEIIKKNNKSKIIKKKNRINYENNDFNKIKKRIKIIRTHHDIYYRNYNNIKNNTLKDYILNFSHSNKSTQNHCIRLNDNKNYKSVNISSNNLNINQNKEEKLIYPKNIKNKNKLNFINSQINKKVNNQTTPITENISRKYSSKKKVSNKKSFKINNKNIIFQKDNKKALILTTNNSKILNKSQTKKSNNNINRNKNIKYFINNIKKETNDSNINNEIKVLKTNQKKKKIIINKKNNLYNYYSNDINSDSKNISNLKELYSTENEKPLIYKINIKKNDIKQRNTKLNNNKNASDMKKISKSNSKSKNSINNSINSNIIKNRTMINNKKKIINIKTSETDKNSEKILNRQQLIKHFLIDKKKYKINYIKKNALHNKISKKSSEFKIIKLLPQINKNRKNKQSTLTYNSLATTQFVNNNTNNNSSFNIDNIKQNNTKNQVKNKKINLEFPHNRENNNKIINNSIDYDILKNEIKNNKQMNEYNDINSCQNNYFFEESEKLSIYIKNYYNFNNDYPPSNISFYKFGRVIGKGAFGKVNIGLHILTGRIVAIKSFNKTKFTNESYKNKIVNEINIMKNLKHFSVVKLLDTIETDKYILLVMENILGGDLLTFLKKRNKLQEKTAKFIFNQLLQALKYIHSKNIVHRDIKLDNILIDLNNNIKLCDFGVGKYIQNSNELLYEQCGTPAYIAPEVLAGGGYCGFPVDLWSSGVVLYSLLMGKIPFKAQKISELQDLIMSGNYKIIEGISKNASDLLNKLLEINPSKRISVDEALNHPWFLDNNDYNSTENKYNLFTKAELILLSKNNVDYRNCPKEDIIENFTIENLDTNKFNENKNIKTKSIIFAPFNTSYELNELKNDNFNLKEIKLEKGLVIQNNIILYDQDANALNRQYELNNNGEIDHGVIINHSNEKENIINNNNTNKKEKEIKENVNAKIINKTNDNDNENINSDLYNKNEKNNLNVEKDNFIKINKAKIPYDTHRNKNSNIMNSNLTYSSTMVLDDKYIKYMENFGYKKEYIQKCILNNELNYCHATYYLLLNSQDLSS